MELHERFKDYLAKEGPVLSRRERWCFVSFMGLFVFLFMLFFQPFGVNNYDPQETITAKFFLVMFLIGMLVTFLLALNEFILFPMLIRRPRRSLMLLWIMWSVVWMGSGLFLFYNYLCSWHDFLLRSYFEFLVNIGSLSLIPLIGLLMYIKIREVRKSSESAHAYKPGAGEEEFLLVLSSENQKDRFSLPLKLLLFIKSEENYVSIYHLLNDNVTRTLFRKNLKRIQEEAHHPALLRCHRSYMINLIHLQKIQGNRNKLKVFLHHVQEPLPVSRQYMDTVFKLIST